MRRVTALLAALTLSIAAARQEPKASALASFDAVWQTIHDTAYNLESTGVDWNAVRVELRPKAEAAASTDGVRAIITEMLARLHRSHFVLLPSGGDAASAGATVGPASVPIDVRVSGDAIGGSGGAWLLVTRVEPDSGAQREGIRPGQILRQIDGTPVAAWIPTLAPGADPRVRNLEMWRQATRALHGAAGSLAVLQVSDGDTVVERRVPRVIESGQVVTLGNLPPLRVRVDTRDVPTGEKHTVGVIAFNIWMAQVDAPFAAAVDAYRRADGIVIDLRGNPGGLAAMIGGIAGHFFATPEVLGTMHANEATLQFRANPRLSTTAGRRVEPFAGPVAVLVDGLTGSASECFTAGMQALGRVRVFGRQTMGAALPASTKTLPDGDVLMYAVGDFITSRGPVEGQGVIPDEIVPLTSAALRAGHDPDVDAALAWIDRTLAGR